MAVQGVGKGAADHAAEAIGGEHGDVLGRQWREAQRRQQPVVVELIESPTERGVTLGLGLAAGSDAQNPV